MQRRSGISQSGGRGGGQGYREVQEQETSNDAVFGKSRFVLQKVSREYIPAGIILEPLINHIDWCEIKGTFRECSEYISKCYFYYCGTFAHAQRI